MTNRNYSTLQLLITLNHVGAALMGLSVILVLMSDYGLNTMIPLMAICAIFGLACLVQAQVIKLMLNAAGDVESIAATQRENVAAIRRNLETQTNLLTVMAQHQGVSNSVLNDVIADVGLQLPEDAVA